MGYSGALKQGVPFAVRMDVTDGADGRILQLIAFLIGTARGTIATRHQQVQAKFERCITIETAGAIA